MRVGEDTNNHQNDCGPSYFQLKPRLAIRHERFVSLRRWVIRLLLQKQFTANFAKNQLQTRRLRRFTGHGAVAAGEADLTFAQLCQRNQPQLKERHDALSFQKIKLQSGTRLRERLRNAFLRKKRTQWCADFQAR